MQTYTINFNIPSDWSELGDKRLRYVYELIAGALSDWLNQTFHFEEIFQ